MAANMVLLLLLVMGCAASSEQQQQQLSEECEALRSFLGEFAEDSPVHQMLSPSWMSSASTSHATNCCTWQGIACDSSSRVRFLSLPRTPGPLTPLSPHLAALTHLEELSLPSLNLTGRIPLSIVANCSRLSFLDLSYNVLTGTIPASLFTLLPSLAVLRLNSNHLSGIIPPEIGLCKTLSSVSLQDNQLSGSIPAEIGQLSFLRIFHAGGNSALSGSLPPELGNCSSLVQFGVAVTRISGSIPSKLGSLSNLRILSLFQTNISGEIPPEIGNCSQLEQLHMYLNYLTGTIPRELGKLRKLWWLNLWGNKLSGEIPAELAMLESLIELDISTNELTGRIPSRFGSMRQISKLYLSINRLSGGIPPELGNCSNITNLQLDRNTLSGNIPSELGKLSKLSVLYLWSNSLQGELSPSLANCKELTLLDFSWNLLTGTLQPDLFTLPSLQKVMLVGNEFSGKIPSAIAGCKSLQRLRLSNNRLTGSIPPELGELQNLTYFDIGSNQISGTIPATIANCRSLQLFDAHDNHLQGPIPPLNGLSNLQSLDLSFNLLTGPLPPSFASLGSLDTLMLSCNALSGQIPSELSGCRKLTYLDLSSNSLSGTIPPSLGQISTLSIGLNMCCNSLSGPIPQAFTQMSALAALDISHNKLCGNLDVLGRMDSLTSLNISYNLFSGRLPNALPFTSMSRNNYVGNPGLCKPSCFANMTTDGGGRKGSVLRDKAINGPLFAAVGLMFAVGSFMLCSVVRISISRARARACTQKQQDSISWPWVLTPFQKFSFTMQDILDRMVDSNIIGKGCSGVVYRAVMPEGEVIAVKKVLVMASKTAAPQRNFFKTEMEILREIRHKNIVRLLGFGTNRESSLLLYDYMSNGSLEECMHKKRRMLDWERRYNIALGAAQGLAYLHHDCRPPILHRDVKASNILLGAHLEPYLADFGLAKLVMNSSTSGATQTVLAGSYGYIAPEYAYSLSITEKSDVYSYGVVLLEMLTGKRPMEASLGEGRHLTEWVHEMQHISDDVVDILDPCLRGMADPFVKEMLQTLTLALECVHPLPSERPFMRHVVTLLLHIRHPPIHNFAKLDDLACASCHAPTPHLSNKDTNFHTHTTYFSSPNPSHNLSINHGTCSPKPLITSSLLMETSEP